MNFDVLDNLTVSKAKNTPTASPAVEKIVSWVWLKHMF